MKNKRLAAVLAILLGGVGAQHFYLANYLTAMFCLLFSWTGIPMLIGIFQGLGYLTMNEREFNSRFNWKFMELRADKREAS